MAPNLVTLLLSISFSSFAVSIPAGHSNDYPDFVHPSNGICKDYKISTTVDYTGMPWIVPHFTNNYDVTALEFNSSAKGVMDRPLYGSPQNVTGTFETAATFCKPANPKGGKETTVLIATHGIGFDRRYWASSYKPEKYNFVQYALNEGYSVFYYDRIGVGHSARISGYTNLGDLQSEVLAALIRAVKKGQYTADVKAKKLALIGHSFGSFLSTTILRKYPDLVDAAALTGAAFPNPNDSALTVRGWGPAILSLRIAKTLAPENRPQFAETLDTGYVAPSDMYAYVLGFLHQPNYEVGAAQYSAKIVQALSISEFFSLTIMPSPEFKGKVFLTSGQFDILLCNGDCYDTFEKGVQNDAFKKAKVSTYVQPGAGHGQNFEGNAVELYAEIMKFLATV